MSTIAARNRFSCHHRLLAGTRRRIGAGLAVAGLLLLWAAVAPAQETDSTAGTRVAVVIETSLGDIQLQLYAGEAPLTVTGFLALVDAGYYDRTIFHRVMPDLIQGGGYTAALERRERGAEVINEAADAPPNRRGTIAMVHEPGRPHSATAEFFINVADNAHLDHRNLTPRGYGWAVFGEVVEGLEVVDAIAAVATGASGPFLRDCPLQTITINRIRRAAN